MSNSSNPNVFSQIRQNLSNAHTLTNQAEASATLRSGASAGKMSRVARIANLKKFRAALEGARESFALDITLTGTSGQKETYRLYATSGNRKALLGRVNETISEL